MVLLFILSLFFAQEKECDNYVINGIPNYTINNIIVDGVFYFNDSVYNTLTIKIKPSLFLPKYYIVLGDDSLNAVRAYPNNLKYETPLEFVQDVIDSVLCEVNDKYWENFIKHGGVGR